MTEIQQERPLVTVVVPVYNAGETLRSTVASITGQTWTDLEILLIDDGSSDGSLELCRQLAAGEPRIRVIHQENQGVSAARNAATAQARGKYITYVDADDVLAPGMVENGVGILEGEGLELVIGADQKISGPEQPMHQAPGFDTVLLEPADYDILRNHYFYSGAGAFGTFPDQSCLIERAPHARILTRELAAKAPYPRNVGLGEDVIWNMRLLNGCSRVAVTGQIWYGYVIREDSAIRRYHPDRRQQVEAYLKLLQAENAGYFARTPCAWARNLAVELYCIANYELLAPDCPLRDREKVQLVKQMINAQPWKALEEHRRCLSPRHRVLGALYRNGLWLPALKAYARLKSWRRR